MAINRADRRREAKAKARPKVYIPVPQEFRDMDERPWTFTDIDTGQLDRDLTLQEVLIHTLKFSRDPGQGDDSIFRALDIREAIKAQQDREDYIELDELDFDWMMARFKRSASRLWLDVNAAYLIRWLEKNKSAKPPPDLTQSAAVREAEQVAREAGPVE